MAENRTVAICGHPVSRRVAGTLTLLARASGLTDSAADERDFSVLTERVLHALPSRLGRLDARALRGVGTLRLREVEEFLGRFEIVLPEKVAEFKRRGSDSGGYFTGPPNVYGFYWWRAEVTAEAAIRQVTAESDPRELVAGWWAGPLEPPPVSLWAVLRAKQDAAERSMKYQPGEE